MEFRGEWGVFEDGFGLDLGVICLVVLGLGGGPMVGGWKKLGEGWGGGVWGKIGGGLDWGGSCLMSGGKGKGQGEFKRAGRRREKGFWGVEELEGSSLLEFWGRKLGVGGAK